MQHGRKVRKHLFLGPGGCTKKSAPPCCIMLHHVASMSANVRKFAIPPHGEISPNLQCLGHSMISPDDVFLLEAGVGPLLEAEVERLGHPRRSDDM